MSPDLCIALHGGRALLQIHPLHNGIFAEFLLDGQHRLLAAALTFQFFLFLGILRLRLFRHREKIQLLTGFRFAGGLLYLGGMLLMLYNCLMTIRSGKAVDAPVPAVVPAHA